MKIKTILETCLYAKDLGAIEKFYAQTFDLQPFAKREGRHVFYRLESGMLLYFNPEVTSTEVTIIGGEPIPLHGATGEGHLCFSCPKPEIDNWKKRLAEKGVPIEAEVVWPGGTRSIYFRDPAGNCLEFASPKMWGLQE